MPTPPKTPHLPFLGGLPEVFDGTRKKQPKRTREQPRSHEEPAPKPNPEPSWLEVQARRAHRAFSDFLKKVLHEVAVKVTVTLVMTILASLVALLGYVWYSSSRDQPTPPVATEPAPEKGWDAEVKPAEGN